MENSYYILHFTGGPSEKPKNFSLDDLTIGQYLNWKLLNTKRDTTHFTVTTGVAASLFSCTDK